MVDPAQYLRAATQLRHKALEAQPCFARIMQPEVSLHDYASLLTLLYRFHAQAEPTLNDRLRDLPWRDIHRARVELLASDLKALDLPLPSNTTQHLELKDEHGALGAVYVIEGSALGGQIIARHLRNTLQHEVSQSLAFYGTLSRDVGIHWQKVIGQLRHQLTTDEARQSALDGANATFDSLLALASKNGAEAPLTATA